MSFCSSTFYSRSYFSFAVVRNPFNRIISEYFYINKSFEGKPINNFNENQFNTWLDTNLIKFDIDHKLPQSSFLDVPVDMVLKLENIDEDFKKLNKVLGTNFKMDHTNKSTVNKNKIVESLSKDTKDKIYNIFKKDFENFGY